MMIDPRGLPVLYEYTNSNPPRPSEIKFKIPIARRLQDFGPQGLVAPQNVVTTQVKIPPHDDDDSNATV